ncbi:RloB family protein [Streptococcus sp. NLN64]|uniref:RloB family protein n=1 Tax=Streptococcus sp. NLN64 TaxID=2822799 RepID=UPI0018CA11BC|nr:RloB family protein [Streptococcus sp. NLN64]MBG9368113.1 RloB domain-containing protein [Streptococcus sp. NLN64]
MGRRASTRRKNPPQIHVYTEGETEIIYWNCLKSLVGTVDGKKLVVKSLRKQGLDLFYHVRNRYQNHDFKNSPVEICILVDKDDTPNADLLKLENLCKQEGYDFYCSNECFELWLLSHYRSITASMSRRQLYGALEKEIGRGYCKTDKRYIEKIVTSFRKAIENSGHYTTKTFIQNPYTNMGQLLRRFFRVVE